jgi:hypothetical protein
VRTDFLVPGLPPRPVKRHEQERLETIAIRLFPLGSACAFAIE